MKQDGSHQGPRDAGWTSDIKKAAVSALLRAWQAGRQPILVIGHGRSGTTWVGNVLSAARRVLYYFEPLHPNNAGTADLTNWFRYAPPGATAPDLASVFDPVFAGLPNSASQFNRANWHRWLPGYRVLVKDVASLMAVQWLYERYKPLVVIVARHPCPVIVSELRQGTPPAKSLRTMLQQRQLVRHHLRPYLKHIEELETRIELLAGVWAARHRVVANSLREHPEWRVVQYEALCADPVGQFKGLCESLKLRWSDAMTRLVRSLSQVHVSGMYSGRRVSRLQIDAWKSQMAKTDVIRVRQVAAALDIPFYATEGQWELTDYS